MTITYPEAIVVGALQGVSELFPVSSLGHSILLPAWVGGQWAKDLDMSTPGSPYLAVLVAMHVATALALVIFFRQDWIRILAGLWDVARTRQIRTADARLGVLLVLATIPVGLAGLALEKAVRNYLGTPIPTSIFLALNGAVLLSVEVLRRRAAQDDKVLSPAGGIAVPPAAGDGDHAGDQRLADLSIKDAVLIGAAQIAALFPGVSRSGVTMAAGLTKGLRHEDSARFAFLLATPVILAAGVLKTPELFTPTNQGVLGPALTGALVAGVLAYLSVKFLVRYFETRTLTPFAVYCLVAGFGSAVFFVLRG